MSKRKNKSRLIKADVNVILELQRKAVAYESYILVLEHMSNTCNEEPSLVVFNTPLDEKVEQAYENLITLRKIAKENEKGNVSEGA